jgi:hypothetical protein
VIQIEHISRTIPRLGLAVTFTPQVVPTDKQIGLYTKGHQQGPNQTDSIIATGEVLTSKALRRTLALISVQPATCSFVVYIFLGTLYIKETFTLKKYKKLNLQFSYVTSRKITYFGYS